MATSRSQPVGRPLLTFQIPDRHGFAATEPSTTACESTPGLAVQINRTEFGVGRGAAVQLVASQMVIIEIELEAVQQAVKVQEAAVIATAQ